MKRKILLSIMLIAILSMLVSGCGLSKPMMAGGPLENSNDTFEVGISTCNNYLSTMDLAVSNNDPNECNIIPDDVEQCHNQCLYNFAWETLNKEYCKYGTNPLMPLDVSMIEDCYIHIAQVNKDVQFCNEIEFDLEGNGYLYYRPNEPLYQCYSVDRNEPFCAEITPQTNCYLMAAKDTNDCDNLDASNALKDVCYFQFVKSDFTHPEFENGLPFSCESMKTEEGKVFCQSIKDVSKLTQRGIGTLDVFFPAR